MRSSGSPKGIQSLNDGTKEKAEFALQSVLTSSEERAKVLLENDKNVGKRGDRAIVLVENESLKTLVSKIGEGALAAT